MLTVSATSRWASAGLLWAVVLILLTGCRAAGGLQAATAAAPASDKLAVVATTNIVGDVVAAVGGEAIDLVVLMPLGADPHAFEPTPRDLAAVAAADLVFINGAGLEANLEPSVRSAATGPVVALSEAVPLRRLDEGHPEGDADPHVWLDPTRVLLWVDRIEAALTEQDPDRAEVYSANAEMYRKQLRELDTWIAEQVAKIPLERRKLVTDHQVFGYFAERYGFEQVGALMPGFSTLAEPSAREVAELERRLVELDVPAVFVGSTVNPVLAERLAGDTGVKVVVLYTGSLSGPGGPAETYLDLMRFNVTAMVAALR